MPEQPTRLPAKVQAMIGQRYGRWTVVRALPLPADHYNYSVWCRCDCGTEKAVQVNNLRSGKSTGCYCWKQRPHKHGGTGTREYKSWKSMRSRCLHRTNKQFPDYGGRGITICQRWLDSFAHFLADMGSAPSRQHSIDRINNDGPYSPENCRWATAAQQNRNTRNNRYLEFQGKRMILTDWATALGVPYKRIHDRLRHGWTVEEALTLPVAEGFRIRWARGKKRGRVRQRKKTKQEVSHGCEHGGAMSQGTRVS
jgi:hypothetical protein